MNKTQEAVIAARGERPRTPPLPEDPRPDRGKDGKGTPPEESQTVARDVTGERQEDPRPDRDEKGQLKAETPKTEPAKAPPKPPPAPPPPPPPKPPAKK